MPLESTQNQNLYRGPNSSEEFNRRNRTLLKDMQTLYDLLNKNEKMITTNMDIVLRENFFLQNHLQELQEEVSKLTQLLEVQQGAGGEGDAQNVFLQNFYSTKGLFEAGQANAAHIDKTYGVAMPKPSDESSRLHYVTDSGEVFLPSGLSLFAREAADTKKDGVGNIVYSDLHEDTLSYAVDKNKATFWVRDVSYPESDAVNEVFGELRIRIPVEGLNSLFANSLTLHPYPEGSMRIRDIQYRGYNNQWSRLENYPTETSETGEVPVVIENCRKLFFQFGRTEIVELRIFYSQPYWFENEGRRTFSYGFQDIDLSYKSFTEKQCELVSVLDLTGKNAVFSKIGMPEAISASGTESNIRALVSHQLYYDASLQSEFDFNSVILAPLEKVYIKTVLKKEGDSIPVLKEIRFPYTFQSIQTEI